MNKDVAPEDVLNGLLDACESKEAAEIPEVFAGYCKGKELCGPGVALSADERLGHIKPEKRTISAIASALAMDPTEIAELIHGLAGQGTQTEIELASSWFENEIKNGAGSSLPIARRPTWLFRHDNHSADPFSGDLSCLPWNLGLTQWARTPTRTPVSGEIACLGYRLPSSAVKEARLPTLIDAGYEGAMHFWHSGGKTTPHPHGPATCKSALEEVVSEPPLLAHIEQPIVRFKSKSL